MAGEVKIAILETAIVVDIGEDAARISIDRGTLRLKRDGDGKVHIRVVGTCVTPPNAEGVSDHPIGKVKGSSKLVEELHERVRYLELQLEDERRARTEDNRRKDPIIADSLQRVPKPGTPQQTHKTSEVAGNLRDSLQTRASLAVEAVRKASLGKRKLPLGILSAIVALALLVTTVVPAFFTETQNVAIPSYFYPGALWTQIEHALPEDSVAIINPSSGPGSSIDQSYVAQVDEGQSAGLTVLGYVHTDYGRRSSAVVRSEIDKYYSWYGVDGIFLDEGSTDCSHAASYYKDLYDYVHNRSGKVVVNPGTQTNECFMDVADVVVNFEDTYANYRAESYSQPEWVSEYPPTRFWHLVHAAPTTADMQEAVGLSKERNAGFVYVTSDTLPNPWDTLPAFLSDEQKAVQEIT